MPPLKFEISLTVLNHLGRNLYRSFATVLGEAISNSWDAEAEEVRVTYVPTERFMCVVDNGLGMNRKDLQDKFLKIGYSKRDDLGPQSPNKKRHHIGRKGIGKLALLSCADRVVILSRKSDEERCGVIIDNAEVDQEIKKGNGVTNYELKEPDLKKYEKWCTGEKGTIICFEGLKDDRGHTEEYIKKVIALYFRFSLIEPEFKIFLNDQEVTVAALADLANKTQFIWNINGYDADPYLEMPKPATGPVSLTAPSKEIRGFIASVKKPTDRNIFGAKERIGVDLYVNGRMRELDILKHAPTSQLPEEYLYGQIHIDSFDGDSEADRFTSSREGVQADDPVYKKYLGEIKSLVLKIIDQWDDLRDKFGDDGDPENITRESAKIKKAKSLYRQVAHDFVGEAPTKSDTAGFLKDLEIDAAFNGNSYLECFIAENLLRKYIVDKGTTPTACTNVDQNKKTCLDRYNPKTGSLALCEYCKGTHRLEGLKDEKTAASVSIQIRADEKNLLMYLDYVDLAKIIDDKILKKEDSQYKPLRNSVMHTSRLTEEAKIRLTSVFNNIVATVRSLLGL